MRRVSKRRRAILAALSTVLVLVAAWSIPDGSTKRTGPWQAFDEAWFRANQRGLLSLLNDQPTRSIARTLLCVDQPGTIYEIAPNHVTYGARQLGDGRVELTTDFRSHHKWSKRIWCVGRPLWLLLGAASLPEVEASSLTAYPNPHPESVTVDGSAYTNVGRTWANLHAASGDAATDTANELYIQLQCTTVSNQYDVNVRNAILFDTSSMGAGASVSAATLSLYGSRKGAGGWSGVEVKGGIYTSTPASNTAISASDYQNFGTTAQSATTYTYTGWSLTGYNDYALNATGLSTVAAASTSVVKLAWLEAQYDVPNVAPTWSSGGTEYITSYSADQTGTANDPKLVVTYTTPPPGNALDLAGN